MLSIFKKQIFYGIISGAAFGVFALTACQKNQKSETIRIGEVGSMTGSDATFGISTHNGISLAIAEINALGGVRGKKLELFTLDDQGKASEAVAATLKLISQHKVRAVLGEVASTLSLAMAPLAEQYQVPMISPSSINSKLTFQKKFVFRVCFLDLFQSEVMAKFALSGLKSRRVAILRDMKSDYSRDITQIFTGFFEKGGGKIVINQSYGAGDIDFKSQITAIRAVRPDLILVPGYYTEVALIARQVRELGLTVPLLGGDGWDSPKLLEIAAGSLDGSYFVSHFRSDDSSPHIQKFIHQYQENYQGNVPDGLAALGYDAVGVLADALRREESASNQDLMSAIALTQNFPGVTGKISINPEHNAVKAAVILKIDAGNKLKLATIIQPSSL